jgi:hypothetical protein
LDFAPFIYDTDLHNFEKDLSILDLLMWNSPDAVVQGIRRNSSLISGQESSAETSRYPEISFGKTKTTGRPHWRLAAQCAGLTDQTAIAS